MTVRIKKIGLRKTKCIVGLHNKITQLITRSCIQTNVLE